MAENIFLVIEVICVVKYMSLIRKVAHTDAPTPSQTEKLDLERGELFFPKLISEPNFNPYVPLTI